jgi:hypothetical protein
LSRLYGAVCVLLLHLFLVLTVSCQQTFWILAGGHTSLPSSLDRSWYKAGRLTTALLGQTLAVSNPVREGITAYIHSTGIAGGYGFFAPGVPSSYKLVFELHYDDGRVEYELPHVNGVAAGLRLSSLLDQIGDTQYDPLREVMLKMLAYSTWREHPSATTIRTVFGYVDVPSAVDLKQGKKESYNFLYAYDFVFPSQPTNPQPR